MYRAIDALISALLFFTVFVACVNTFVAGQVNLHKNTEHSVLASIAEASADCLIMVLGDSYSNWTDMGLVDRVAGYFIYNVTEGEPVAVGYYVDVSIYRIGFDDVGVPVFKEVYSGSTSSIREITGTGYASASRTHIINDPEHGELLVVFSVTVYSW